MRVSLLVILLLPLAVRADVVLSEGTNLSVDVAADGRIIFDLLGGLWLLPDASSQAQALSTGRLRVFEPRWSPDAERIAFTAERAGQAIIHVYDVDSEAIRSFESIRLAAADIAWHPDGTRLTFSSAVSAVEADIHEVDLVTGLTWRLTSLPGAETDPAWSDDGRSLVYVHRIEDEWSLKLRRFGEPDRVLIVSEHPLSSPPWRPDGSLISYLKHDGEIRVHMLILSDPMLDRELVADSDIFDTPLAWRDRRNFIYAANGSIKRRDFSSWIPRNVPFRAEITREPVAAGAAPSRTLTSLNAPDKEWVLRVDRAYSGGTRGHQSSVDILIRGGSIAAVEPQRDRGTLPVIDLGDVTAVPGYIDAYAALPDAVDASLGPLLLSLGITTMASQHQDIDALNAVWSGSGTPGPRLLRFQSLDTFERGDEPWLVTIDADSDSESIREARRVGAALLADSWQTFLSVGASLVIGSQSSPASPAGRRYKDVELATQRGPFRFVSAMAGLATPGVAALASLRQAKLLKRYGENSPREAATLRPGSSQLVLGSLPNRFPPGLATIAELKAMTASGRPGHEVLDAAGRNAAEALGLAGQLGAIEAGAAADLVILAGDPLASEDALTSVVAVVRNGRFFSAVGLIDRAK